MAEILEFPTREKQAFAFLEQQLRQMLSTKGADDRLIEHAIASLTDVYAELNATPTVILKCGSPSNCLARSPCTYRRISPLVLINFAKRTTI